MDQCSSTNDLPESYMRTERTVTALCSKPMSICKCYVRPRLQRSATCRKQTFRMT